MTIQVLYIVVIVAGILTVAYAFLAYSLSHDWCQLDESATKLFRDSVQAQLVESQSESQVTPIPDCSFKNKIIKLQPEPVRKAAPPSPLPGNSDKQSMETFFILRVNNNRLSSVKDSDNALSVHGSTANKLVCKTSSAYPVSDNRKGRAYA